MRLSIHFTISVTITLVSRSIISYTMSNHEGEFPSWPIPTEWTNAEAISKLGVVLHGNSPSPPCCKIKCILDRYKVKYTEIAGAKKGSDYKLIPVLMIDGKQINDSEIIATVLSKILDAEGYTEKEVLIEKLITTELMVACEVHVMENTADLQKCACAAGGALGCILYTISCCVPCMGVSKKLHAKYPNLKTVSEIAKVLADHLGAVPYFHGDTCGVIDCSLYGVLSPFMKAKNEPFADFMSADVRLREWHERMSSTEKSIYGAV